MSQIIKFFRSYFFCFIYILFITPKIKKMCKHKNRYSFSYRYEYLMNKANTLAKLLKIRIEVTGLENINTENPILFTPNHNSILDPLMLGLVIDKPIRFVSKVEASKKPFFGNFLNLIDTLLIDRENLRQSVQIIADSKDILNNGTNVCIFPEGTRNKTDKYDLLEFKPGCLKVAMDTNSPIAPVVIKGTKDIFSSSLKKYYLIKIEFLKMINPEDYDNSTSIELSKQIFASMQSKIASI